MNDTAADYLSTSPLPQSNFDFLQALFGTRANDAFVTGFKEDPTGKHDTRTRARMWRGQRWGDLREPLSRAGNNYFCISTFKASADPADKGKARRRKDLHTATFVIVFDDVGVGQKVPLENIKLAPTYVLQTSPGNSQYGYRLTTPEADAAKVERLINGLIATGLATGGKDPGMAGVTRFIRLPYGVNTKTKYGALGVACELKDWHPERSYTVEQIAEAHAIDLSVRAQGARAQTRLNITDDQRRDMVEKFLSAMEAEELLIGEDPNAPGKWHVRCPWMDQHQDGDDSGTAYFEPGYVDKSSGIASDKGGFKCHHGHCENRHLHDVVSWLREHDHLEVMHPDIAVEFSAIVEEGQRLERDLFDALVRDEETGLIRSNKRTNAEIIMLHDRVICEAIRFNEFTNTHEIMKEGISGIDSFIGWMLIEIEQVYDCTFSEATARLMLHRLLDQNRYDPLREWAEALVWDKVPRMDDMLVKYAGAVLQDASYVRAVTRAFMIGAAWRALVPGYKFDNMLILEGKQGVGKSTLCRALSPRAEWAAAGILDVQHKDAVADLQGVFVYEVEELQMFKRARDMDTLKAFLSRTHDRVRLSYRRDSESFPRRAAFIGTTNKGQYLEDDEGAAQRRFWPVQVGCIDREWFPKHVEQVWAEAVHAARAGELPVLAEAVLAHAEQEQLSRSHTVSESPLYQVLLRLWADPEYKHRWPQVTTASEVLGMLGYSVERQDIGTQQRIARVLKEIGYDRVRVRYPRQQWQWHLRPDALLS